MGDRKQDWANTHSQLWTSLKTIPVISKDMHDSVKLNFSGESNAPPEVHADVTPSPKAVARTALLQCQNGGADLHSFFTGDVIDNLEQLKNSLNTDSYVKDLISCLLVLNDAVDAKVRISKMRPIDDQREGTELYSDIVAEITERLGGTSEAISSEHHSLGDALGRILDEVKGCQKVLSSITDALGGCDELSLHDALKHLHGRESSILCCDGCKSSKCLAEAATLAQVADVLEEYGSVDNLSNIPSVALSVVKELEMLKRVHSSDMLRWKELEVAACERLALYGDSELFSLKRDNEAGRYAVEDLKKTQPWLEEALGALYDALVETNPSYPDVITPAKPEPLLLTDGTYSRTNILFILQTAGSYLHTYHRGRLGDMIEGVPRTEGSRSHSERLLGTIPPHISRPPQLLTPDPEAVLAVPSPAAVDHSCILSMIFNSLPASVKSGMNLKFGGVGWDYSNGTKLVEAVKLLSHQRLGSDDLASIIEMNRYLRSSFDLDSGNDTVTHILPHDVIDSLQDTVTAVCMGTQSRASVSGAHEQNVQRAIQELAQLLPTGTPPPAGASVRVDPPTQDLLQMVELIKGRFALWTQQQNRQQLIGSQCRMEKARLEEAVLSYGKHLLQIVTDMCVMREEGEASDQVAVPSEMPLQPAAESSPVVSVDRYLSDAVDRMKVVKGKYVRLLQLGGSKQAHINLLSQRNNSLAKKITRITATVQRICGVLGVRDTDEAAAAADAQKTTASNGVSVDDCGKDENHPQTHATYDTIAVSENNLLDALKVIERRVSTDNELQQQALSRAEMERLMVSETRWKKDTATFRDAVSMILIRLAENARLIKHTLYMVGTDESADDEVVESVLRRGETYKGSVSDSPTSSMEETQGESERDLAILLQKYSRWSKRLHEATEDHLAAQRKITKYFGAVERFFRADGESGKSKTNAEDNLIDIDTSLTRIADIVLPSLDRIIRSADGDPDSHTKRASDHTDATDRLEALTNLARDGRTIDKLIVPYDPRLARMYEMVGRVHTMLVTLQRVRYLSIPVSTKQRSSGDVELLFDDAAESEYIDVDVGELCRMKDGGAVPERFCRNSGSVADVDALTQLQSPPSSQLKADTTSNNNVLLHATERNLEFIYKSLKKFSSGYKMAAIIVQKDTDMVQQMLAGMLEKYSQLDIENAFGQDRSVLHDMYTVLSERGTRQKGCYFFSRVGGEGPCPWAAALEQLSDGFSGIITKLVQRTSLASQYRDIIDDVVDLCAMYVNWAEHTDIPPSQPLPSEVRARCVREGAVATAHNVEEEPRTPPREVPGMRSDGASKAPLQKPPMPSVPPSRFHAGEEQESASQTGMGKVTHFQDDDVVLKVIVHMFQLAQVACEVRREPSVVLQLEEQVQVLRESLAVSEKRIADARSVPQTLEQERDEAQSEAALARAELRRWKRHFGVEDNLPPTYLAQPTASPQQGQEVLQTGSDLRVPEVDRKATGAMPSTQQSTPVDPVALDANGSSVINMDRDCLLEVLHYLKVLSEELHVANSTSSEADGSVTSPPLLYERGYGTAEEGTPMRRYAKGASSPSRKEKEKGKGKTTSNEILAPSPVSARARRGSADDSIRSGVGARRSTREHGQDILRYVHERSDTPPNSLVVVPRSGYDIAYTERLPTFRSNDIACTECEALGRDGGYIPTRHTGKAFNACETCARRHGNDLPLSLLARGREITFSPSRDAGGEKRHLHQESPQLSRRMSRSQSRSSRTVSRSPLRKSQSSSYFNSLSCASSQRREGRSPTYWKPSASSICKTTHQSHSSSSKQQLNANPCADNRYMPSLCDVLAEGKGGTHRVKLQPSSSTSRTRRNADKRSCSTRDGGQLLSALQLIREGERNAARCDKKRHQRVSGTPPRVMSQSANLRAAALRRLAEVVSLTKIPNSTDDM